MYRPGFVMTTTGKQADPGYPEENEEGYITHDSGLDAEDVTEEQLRRVAYLPHSCDHWVIGGANEVRAMIADLQIALAALEEGKLDNGGLK